ncbi:MAG: PAS domain S-box protein, partial [Candidatus Omnitrophica bacterium]|nr:PAS domain S-box protein [Candidatus Omnitrophota bacterium]
MKPQTVRILVLHSNPEAAVQIRTLLLTEELGHAFSIQAFETLQSARAFLSHNKVDVILASLAVNDGGSLGVFNALKAACPQIPIFILGESRDDALALRVVGAGAQDYLVRSTFNPTMLSRVLRYAIERKKFETHIHIAQEKYRTVFEKSAAAITVTDGNKRIISWNHQAEQLLGLSREQMKDKSVSELYPPEEWQRIRCYQDETRHEQDYLETQIIRTDGERVDVGLSISMILDPDGNLTGSIGILQNISERKRIERMKDDFISTVSHELRTPLTIMRESVSQVHDKILGEVNEDQEMVLGLALEGIDRLTRIVNDLLDMSKLEAGKVQLNLERFDIVQAAREVCQVFSAKASSQGLKIAVEGPHRSEVTADRDKIIQVLTNLVGNALKFTEQGGVLISIEERAAKTVVSVKDTGR